MDKRQECQEKQLELEQKRYLMERNDKVLKARGVKLTKSVTLPNIYVTKGPEAFYKLMIEFKQILNEVEECDDVLEKKPHVFWKRFKAYSLNDFDCRSLINTHATEEPGARLYATLSTKSTSFGDDKLVSQYLDDHRVWLKFLRAYFAHIDCYS